MIPVIDLFAGPGGLNEGFSSLGEDTDSPFFRTVGSFEMETSACSTLRLRGTYRHLKRSAAGVPDRYYSYIRGEIDTTTFASDPRVAEAQESADAEVHQVELGVDRAVSDAMISEALLSSGITDRNGEWALIGGPPCQAYSLVGRARRKHDVEFENDKKHFLYREYLHIIATFEPPVFVMENVKGLLSSTNRGDAMFGMIKHDLETAGRDGYDIYSLSSEAAPADLKPTDFIIRAEEYGVPQRRHRVILLGIRKGYLKPGQIVGTLTRSSKVSVKQAIGLMPRLRSGVSPARLDDAGLWDDTRLGMEREYRPDATGTESSLGRGGPFVESSTATVSTGDYGTWIGDDRIGGAIQHESRSHMIEDLKRYWYASHRAELDRVSPKLRDFPRPLLPNHANATSDAQPFNDRFRVQLADDPSTTVVSHIAKDGHYYIHHDRHQMRSLTVREAARLQTFPDNYFFLGNRTQQYHQVGNAVPPLLANQIAAVVADVFRGATAELNDGVL